MISFLKNYFREEKNIGIFQSIMLVSFFLFFIIIICFILTKNKTYYRKLSSIPLEKDKHNHEV